MKMSRAFIVVMVVLFALLMAISFYVPRTFDWTDTYSHTSDEPFGCKFYDEMMQQSCPNGYDVSPLTLSQWTSMDTTRKTFLIVSNKMSYFNLVKPIQKALLRGDNVVIVCSYCNDDSLERYLDVDFYYGYFSVTAAQNETGVATLHWHHNNETTDYVFHPSFRGGTLETNDDKYELLVDCSYKDSGYHAYDYYGNHRNVAVIKKQHKGKLLLCSNPYLFTNYAVRTPAMCNLSMRLMSQVSEYPVVRLDPTLATSNTTEETKDSLFRVFLQNPPLRWALYLALFTLVLGMMFTARRRQRIIPVIAPPVNRSLAMVRHIGSLYFNRHDHADLLAKKYVYFAEQVRRRTMVDIDDYDHFDTEIESLAACTGLDKEYLTDVISRVARLTHSDDVTDKQLCNAIDQMNEILSLL